MFHKCSYCDYQSPYKGNLKTHIKNKHKNHATETVSVQQNEMQNNRGPVIMSISVRTPFTEQDELHVKDEVKDSELLEDSIEVLKIYKLLQRMKNK